MEIIILFLFIVTISICYYTGLNNGQQIKRDELKNIIKDVAIDIHNQVIIMERQAYITGVVEGYDYAQESWNDKFEHVKEIIENDYNQNEEDIK